VSDADAPLLASKLHVPRRRGGAVARTRLDQRLDRAALPPVALVSAPAGFGKTTLLTEWLAGDAEGQRRTAWLSLDRRDSDPSVFWSYLLAALGRVAPDVGADALAALRSTTTTLEHVVATLLNDLDRRRRRRWSWCWTTTTSSSRGRCRSRCCSWSSTCRRSSTVVVASRADPPWPLGRLRGARQLLEIRAADLRFTADEAAAYLNGTMGLDLTARTSTPSRAGPKGWIAALQLAALSLEDRDDPSAFIAGFAGDDRFIVDYLVDEVLDRQPDDVGLPPRDLRPRSFDRVPCAPPSPAGATRRRCCEALERSNLFLVALDDRRRWYRYHHLFGDVLRARLGDERPDAVAELHRGPATGSRRQAIAARRSTTPWPRLITLAPPS
jgi:LuxR family maltose regulon positive regulatory protein